MVFVPALLVAGFGLVAWRPAPTARRARPVMSTTTSMRDIDALHDALQTSVAGRDYARAAELASRLQTMQLTAGGKGKVMWRPDPDAVQATSLVAFARSVGLPATGADPYMDYEQLWEWSVEQPDEFWSELIDFVGLVHEGSVLPVREGDIMPDVEWFPSLRLNFAENLLRHGVATDPLADAEAIVSHSEAWPGERRTWTFAQARADAARVAAALSARGIGESDRCAALLPNVGEAMIAMLGATSVGATWASCSPDFGVSAVSDRFGQLTPKVLIATDGYVSQGKRVPILDKVAELARELGPSLECIVLLPMLRESAGDGAAAGKGEGEAGSGAGGVLGDPALDALVVPWDTFLASGSQPDGQPPPSQFACVPFSHPQFILFSSGTTGLPKCIVHGGGNMLLQHAKELMLHSDVRPTDRLLFYTSTGWMMWNWMASSLLAGATCVLYDGFAAYPSLASPWALVESERVTHVGCSPRFLQASRRRITPKDTFDLSALRVILSTGSPLSSEDYEYVYGSVKPRVQLSSISGGTDICSCFALGTPTLPVVRNELQVFGLGMDVCALPDVPDVDDDEPLQPTAAADGAAAGAPKALRAGRALRPVRGEKAELACRTPFVAAPLGFWGDDDSKTAYRRAYFREDGEAGVWYHGDLIEVTGSVGESGGVVIHGRSDTTLNPGGVRIGTAEIYRFAEDVDGVADSLVVGQPVQRGTRSDMRIVLFVRLEEGVAFGPSVEEAIRSAIRLGASKSHVPAVIKPVQGIPYTRSGKKVELAVRNLLQGIPPRNEGALVDPAALDEYRAFAAECMEARYGELW